MEAEQEVEECTGEEYLVCMAEATRVYGDVEQGGSESVAALVVGYVRDDVESEGVEDDEHWDSVGVGDELVRSRVGVGMDAGAGDEQGFPHPSSKHPHIHDL